MYYLKKISRTFTRIYTGLLQEFILGSRISFRVSLKVSPEVLVGISPRTFTRDLTRFNFLSIFSLILFRSCSQDFSQKKFSQCWIFRSFFRSSFLGFLQKLLVIFFKDFFPQFLSEVFPGFTL